MTCNHIFVIRGFALYCEKCGAVFDLRAPGFDEMIEEQKCHLGSCDL